MKLFLTGDKGIGKSYCIQRMIVKCQMKPCGFLTLPFYENNIRKGFYMHSYLPLANNDVLFSKQQPGFNEVITNTFNEFGVAVLEASRQRRDCVMILDEIGQLEKNEEKYLRKLIMCIQEHPHVLGVLKKCNADIVKAISKMDDVIVLDMDMMTQAAVENAIMREWEKNNA